jgi:hypothetical protein
MRKSLVALMLLASTAAYADKRGLNHSDDMQTARADIRADRRATANLPVLDCAPRLSVPLPETESERNLLLGDSSGLTFAQIEAERKNRAPLYQLGRITYAHIPSHLIPASHLGCIGVLLKQIPELLAIRR